MNEIVVTVGPGHTMREAARRMTAAAVGAAVVIDPEQHGPCIITERDVLRPAGRDEDIDRELVRDHLSANLVYAEVDWSPELAAERMVSGAFRHAVVLDDGEVVGIISMRDIVRCWTREGSACEVPEPEFDGKARAPAS